jgi:hypothetical protein
MRRGGNQAAIRFCDEYFLSFSAMTFVRDLVSQLWTVLDEIWPGIASNQAYVNRRNDDIHLVMAVIGLGLYPDTAIRLRKAKVYTSELGVKTKIHPASINRSLPLQSKECCREIESIAYQELVSVGATTGGAVVAAAAHLHGGGFIGGASLLMLGTCPVSLLSILLGAGEVSVSDIETLPSENQLTAKVKVAKISGDRAEHPANLVASTCEEVTKMAVVNVDGWLKMQMKSDEAELVSRCRNIYKHSLVSFMQVPRKSLHDRDMQAAVEHIATALAVEFDRCSKPGQ